MNHSASGTAGYLLADDGHTHYRYLQAFVTASSALESISVNSAPGATPATTTSAGAEGVELCDENTGVAAQVGLWFDKARGQYLVSYAYGTLPPNLTGDACASNLLGTLSDTGAGPVITVSTGATLTSSGTFSVTQPGPPIVAGDSVYVGVFYNPHAIRGTHGMQHELAFGVTSEGIHRNFVTSVPSVPFTEAGAGAFTPDLVATAFPAIQFTGVREHFYSDTHPAASISVVKGFYGYGGITPVSLANGEVTLSPTPLTADGSFSLHE